MTNILTKTELEIMQYIWSINCEFTAGDIRTHFSHKHWRKQTVTTFLKKLVKLGFLNVKKASISKYYYTVAITERDYKVLPAKTIMRNDFSDSLGDFICALASPGGLTPEQVQQLEDVVSKYKNTN